MNDKKSNVASKDVTLFHCNNKERISFMNKVSCCVKRLHLDLISLYANQSI